MSSEEFALTWDDHHNTLVGVFKKLLETNTLVDCTIAAEGRYLRAHKIVLSACSPYFEMLFSQENEKNPIVVLKDIKFQELQAMIDFIYSGKVKVPEDRLGDFVDAAESLQIKGLGGDNYQKNNSEKKEKATRHVTRKDDCVSPVPHKRKRQTFLSTSEENVVEISSGTNVGESTNNENVSHLLQVDMLDSPADQNSCIASTTSSSAAFSTSVHSQLSSSPLETVLPISESIVVKTEPEPIAEVYLPDFRPKDEDCTEDILGLDSGGDITESVVDVSSQHSSNQYTGTAFPPTASSSDHSLGRPRDHSNAAPAPPSPPPRPSTSRGTPPADVSAIARPHDSPVCAKSIPTPAQVTRHLRKPTGDLSFLCPVCGKNFTEASDLQIHLRTHTGDRSFLCPVCGKTFTEAIALQIHLRIHTGERPYRCDQCNWTTASISDLHNHKRKLHGAPPATPRGPRN